MFINKYSHFLYIFYSPHKVITSPYIKTLLLNNLFLISLPPKNPYSRHRCKCHIGCPKKTAGFTRSKPNE